eukprot:CAMPEP_0174715782 /NCGR_PEP_ID=MMETSP1094-20130205/22396_1 /TAXON_ID=156173 /ORGANISM="Chrysochromulina brevifilum, Strain UTEX LB 985" /LENGTH=177 /DNA_ID=CAMNT_0015915421 /DNA_START=522 /DNA_END=1051 /DNA_ORIENTATION=-
MSVPRQEAVLSATVAVAAVIVVVALALVGTVIAVAAAVAAAASLLVLKALPVIPASVVVAWPRVGEAAPAGTLGALGGAVITRLGNVHGDLTPVVITSMHRASRLVCVLRVPEGDKGKASQLVGLAVGRKIDVLDLAEAHEILLDDMLVNAERDPADENLTLLWAVRHVSPPLLWSR